MRILLFLLAATSIFAFSDSLPTADFIKGFLVGIGEKKAVEDLQKCIKEAESALQNIKKAIELIKTLKPDQVIEGVKLLISTLQSLFKDLQPCLEGYETLKKLIEKLKKADIKKIAANIIKKAPQIVKLVAEFLKAMDGKKYEDAGKALGKIVKMVVLDAEFSEEEPEEFVKGFLKGIKEKTDPTNLLKCVTDIKGIINDIIEAVKKIISLDPIKMIEGLSKLIESVGKLLKMLEPCVKDYPELLRLIEAVKNADIQKLFKKIISNPTVYIMDLISFINHITAGDWYEAGKDLGDIFYNLFLKP